MSEIPESDADLSSNEEVPLQDTTPEVEPAAKPAAEPHASAAVLNAAPASCVEEHKEPSSEAQDAVPDTDAEPLAAAPVAPIPTDVIKDNSEVRDEKRPDVSARSNSFHAPEGSQSKDIVMTELKAMKISSINGRNAALEAEIAAAEAKLAETAKTLENPASETVKYHIRLLHDYNDIRDVGQGLIGMIADGRGLRIGELYGEFGVGLKD